jgi:DNA-binding LytR/AlgR family response regulator
MLKEILPDAEITDNFETINSLVSWLNVNKMPDLMLLDIHLADGSCFEIFKQIKITSPVIFITAYDQYAMQAFKVNCIDYLLKPLKQVELVKSIEKWENSLIKTDFSLLIEQMLHKTKETPLRFVVKYGQFIKAIDVSEVALFYASDKMICITTFDNQTYPIDFSLDRIMEMIDTNSFFRISRSVIINYKSIGQMYAHLKGRIKIATTVNSNVETNVSADRASDFKRWLAGKGI